MFALRRLARQYRHIQEVIVQNFRAKPDTAMRSDDDLDLDESGRDRRRRAAACSARRSGCRRRRTWSTSTSAGGCSPPGIDDWGGVSPVTPDHVNPERPWPQLDDLARVSADAGYTLTRAADRPSEVPRASRGSTRGCARTSRRCATRRPAWPTERRCRWACPGRSPTAAGATPAGPTCTRRSTPRAAGPRPASDFDAAYGDWDVRRASRSPGARRQPDRASTATSRPPRWPRPNVTRPASPTPRR